MWSVGHQPLARPAGRYAARYRPGVLTITRLHQDVEATLEVAVAPDADLEVRRLRLHNRGGSRRRIEVTSYAEVVLDDPAAHASHPAFSKLFVETAEEQGALLAHRRPRSAGDPSVWLVHAVDGGAAAEWETDRVRFLGRGRSAALPLALATDAPLSGTVGSVLDPVVSLRRTVDLAPDGRVDLAFVLGVAETRAAALALGARAGNAAALVAAAEERERGLLGELALDAERAEIYHELAGALLYGCPGLGADPSALSRGSPADVARLGLSGTPPFVAVASEAARADVRAAQAYWRAKGLEVEVVDLAERAPGERELLGALAGAVLKEPLAALPAAERAPAAARFQPVEALPPLPAGFEPSAARFSPDGTEYVIGLDRTRPPMPWVNVVANERFGFLASEAGAGYTWSRNSRENRLTPWSNDPASDPHGEALYVRDEDAAVFWSPLPGPAPSCAPVEVRHGFGYSHWRQVSRELEQDVTMLVPPGDPVKLVRVRLVNVSARLRRLSLVAYFRLVLGGLPSRTVVSEWDAASDALLAENRLRADFGDGIVFAAALPPAGAGPVRWTADRAAFLGRNGSPALPAALASERGLDGRTGPGLDPCAAFAVPLTLAPGATAECTFLLGEATSRDEARALVARYRAAGASERALGAVRAFWSETLSGVRIATPSPALDRLVNGWLPYQNLSCRLWGRSAFYQSGGAFGFRDQLQDAAALVHLRPDLTRAQIVLHAAHQFVEGDVLHWWHPPAGRGTRTRFSDDLVWLPYVTAFYVRTTGDRSVLDEPAPFLIARPLAPGEDDAYLLPEPSGEVADVYAHCCRALDRALTRGAHGLPLMGTGDWNDGMNRVGREGRGESVWLGFFLFSVLGDFVPLCEARGDGERAGSYRAYRAAVQRAIEESAWDGGWYRRAYYDDGTPLGSAASDECRIDALVQAWAVLSGAAPRARAAQAMDAVERELVDERAGIVRLLWPPFDRTPHDPGYIKGYVPGIRENGGQYTHAALWVVRALAELGRRERAFAVLEMLLPVERARTPAYQVEPYVVSADVYGAPPHVGRGGWTWYTGSAGWMYRVALESILGVTLEGGTLCLRPCVPDAWPRFTVSLRLPDGRTRYEIEVVNPSGSAAALVALAVDGEPAPLEGDAARLPIRPDGAVHRVRLTLGTR